MKTLRSLSRWPRSRSAPCSAVATPARPASNLPTSATPSRLQQTTRGEIVLALDTSRPVSVDNFLMHAERGDTTARSSIASFPVRHPGGGFTRLLQERAKIDEAAGGKDPTIVNEWTNGLKNTRGTNRHGPGCRARHGDEGVLHQRRGQPAPRHGREKTGNAG